MFLVDVIPITRGITIDSLTYFTSTKVVRGDIVQVPLRSRNVPALVVSIRDVAEQKSQLKSSSFSIKKIRSKKSHTIVSQEFISAAEKIAHYHTTSLGSVLHTLLPASILVDYEKIVAPKPIEKINPSPDKHILQADTDERWSQYKSMIREAFARKKSIYFCVPTATDVAYAGNTLERGISEYTHTLHSGLTKKQLREVWNAIGEQSHPVLIIGTPMFLGVPRNDIQTIIVERESAMAYKSMTRPIIDMRRFAEQFAEKIGAHCIFGDTLLRVETLWRYNEGELQARIDPKFRSLSTSKVTLVDMKKDHEKEKGFIVLSEELRQQIEHTKNNNERLFIFTVRRGLAPLVVCGDCGATVECNHCHTPVTLHKVRGGNKFICHRCGEIRDAKETCAECTSWKLNTLGIGIELAEEIISEEFPDVTLFRIDADTAKTPAKAQSIMDKFIDTPGSVLLGTEKAIAHLRHSVENSAVLSLDTLFAIPDFRINEKIASLLLNIRSHTSSSFILQTRQPDQEVLKEVLFGNLIEFYRNEIKLRKQFDYPPFSTLITVSIRGEKAKIVRSAEKLGSHLEPWKPITFPVSRDKKGQSNIVILLRIPSRAWPSENLGKILRTLPPNYTVTIDPDRITG
ncbi:primosomal protein N' [Candidatus Wolfebacteria bacterium]|nr:MAG: primosomal protein N' [Candidatus Wolfebacteria bacterium]